MNFNVYTFSVAYTIKQVLVRDYYFLPLAMDEKGFCWYLVTCENVIYQLHYNGWR